MTRTLLLLIAIVSSLPTAHAIQNLPCQRMLESNRMNLKPNEIAVRGKLEAYWEQGMEGHTAWSVIDEQTRRWLSRDFFDSLYTLRAGDRVVVYDNNGFELARGLYSEERAVRTVRLGAAEFLSEGNRPYLKSENGQKVIDSPQFMRLFAWNNEALVIRELAEEEMRELNGKYSLWLAAHRRLSHKRRIDVGNGRTHEAAYFQSLARGELFVDLHGHLKLRSPKGDIELHFSDHLYIDVGGQTREIDIRNYPFKASDELRETVARPHKAVLIR